LPFAVYHKFATCRINDTLILEEEKKLDGRIRKSPIYCRSILHIKELNNEF